MKFQHFNARVTFFFLSFRLRRVRLQFVGLRLLTSQRGCFPFLFAFSHFFTSFEVLTTSLSRGIPRCVCFFVRGNTPFLISVSVPGFYGSSKTT